MGVSRRVFFVGSAVLATGIVVRPMRALARLTNEERARGPIRLGMASYTFREFTRLQLIQYMKDLNLSALNAKDAKDHLPMESTAEAQALADYTAAGIRLHAAGVVSLAVDTDEDMRAKFDYIRRAGVGVMVAGDPTPASLPRIERFAKEYDIRVAIHNHGPEDKLWPSPLDVLKAVQGMDRRLGCCIDVGHTVRAGTDVVEAIHAAGSRLFNMHMKDLTDFHDKASQVAVGDGQMPVPAIFAALEEIRYPGYVDLEYEVHADDPMPGVTKSFAYMRGVLAGMSRGAA
jgi:sugar phosphate isomerase/epimerase